MNKRHLKKYLSKGVRKLRYRKGFGVHSPFAFDIITNVIYENLPYYVYSEIEKNNKEKLNKTLRLKRMLKINKSYSKNARLVFRLLNRFKPTQILQIGSDGGDIISYMTKGSPYANIKCIEPNRYFSDILNIFAIKSKIQNLTVINDTILNAILRSAIPEGSIQFLYIHSFDETELSFYPGIKPIISDQGIIVVNGIHRKEYIYRFWQEIVSDADARVTMDLYDIGLVFFDKKLFKQNYIVSF